MKKYRYWIFTAISGILFVIWVILTKTVDVVHIAGVGPLGFYQFNTSVLEKTALVVDIEKFSKITDILLYSSFLTVASFGGVGLYQLIKRKSFKKVDSVLYLLLGAYVTTVILYFGLDLCKINYAPLLKGEIKTSFPSTHVYICLTYYILGLITLLYYCKFNKLIVTCLIGLVGVVCVSITVLRIYSGCHWMSDIIGSLLLCSTTIFAYISFLRMLTKEKTAE